MSSKNNTTENLGFRSSLGWIFFILLLSAWLVFGMSNTVGIIGGILGILAFLWQSSQWLEKRLRKRHPFILTFSQKPREKVRKDSDMTNGIQLLLGETRFLLRVKTRLYTDFTETFIRPTNRNYHDVFEEGEEPLRITKVEKVDDKSPDFDVSFDNVGGVKVYYKGRY